MKAVGKVSLMFFCTFPQKSSNLWLYNVSRGCSVLEGDDKAINLIRVHLLPETIFFLFIFLEWVMLIFSSSTIGSKCYCLKTNRFGFEGLCIPSVHNRLGLGWLPPAFGDTEIGITTPNETSSPAVIVQINWIFFLFKDYLLHIMKFPRIQVEIRRWTVKNTPQNQFYLDRKKKWYSTSDAYDYIFYLDVRSYP